MQFRTLESVPYETLHAAFLRGFSDYAISFAITRQQLEDMHRRRGVSLGLSVGAFEGEELVGFTFNGLGRWNGRTAGYDSGTAVAPAARGRGLAAEMMRRSLDLLAGAGATVYVLEVLESNTAAYRVYERIGFRVTRAFRSWNLDRLSRSADPDIVIEESSTPDDIHAEAMWDWQPSWQNSIDSIARASEHKTVLLARRDDRVEGYAVLFDSGDLAQFAVFPPSRRRGVGTALLDAARSLSAHPLRIVNTEAEDTGISNFLEAIGATENVRQHEMTLEL